MTLIDPKDILSPISSNEIAHPHSINIVCPNCKRHINLILDWKSQLNKVANYCSCPCPSCRKQLRAVYLPNGIDPKDYKAGELYISPSIDVRQPLDGIKENTTLPDSVKNVYYSVISVYNAGVWSATAQLSRNVLEGITHVLLPNAKENEMLASRLRTLANEIDLKAPIINLTDALRKGGNLGAHFNLEATPNKKIAKLMIDLLDYLIEYLFILPNKIDTLKSQIDDLKNIAN